MPARVKSFSATIIAQTELEASVALRRMADDIVDESTPNTPKDKGNLRNDVIKQVLGLHAEIRWAKVYAQAQEAGTIRGHRIKHYTTPGTGPHFAEDAVRKIASQTDQYFGQAA